MKKSFTTVMTAVALTALVSVPALASVSKNDVDNLVKSSIGDQSKILADVDISTVILTGYFGDMNDKNELLTALGAADGVDRVVDFTLVKQGVSYTK